MKVVRDGEQVVCRILRHPVLELIAILEVNQIHLLPLNPQAHTC
jgi:hypothetical protein